MKSRSCITSKNPEILNAIYDSVLVRIGRVVSAMDGLPVVLTV